MCHFYWTPNSGTCLILGLLSWGPRSGYEVKATVDRSTRITWSIWYAIRRFSDDAADQPVVLAAEKT
jgi:DNA-binding PadR family transcriptional regulator